MEIARTTYRTLVAYGLIGPPRSMASFAMVIYLPTFYTANLGLGLALTGTVLLVSRVSDIVTDPIIGVLSDRTPGRLGRRKPWIVLGLPVSLLSIWMLFAPTGTVGGAYLLGWTSLFHSAGHVPSLVGVLLGVEGFRLPKDQPLGPAPLQEADRLRHRGR